MKFILLASILVLWTAMEASCGDATDAVLDTDGQKLRPNVEYNILPVARGRGGGLTLAARNRSSPCPLNVGQEDLEVSHGLPLTFLPVDSGDEVVGLSTDMNIVFSAATICVQSTAWRLSRDESTGRRYVTMGGETGNPGRSTVSNWFKIEKHNADDYKLVFCPGVCDICRVECGDLGVYVEDGKRWLGISDVPFPVMFKKA